GDVEEHADQCHGDTEQSVVPDFLADRRTDPVFANQFEIRVRACWVRSLEDGLAFSSFGLNGEFFHGAADRAAINGKRFTEILLLHDAFDFLGVQTLSEGNADFVAADKVDAVNVVSADEDARDSEDHESSREDKGRFLEAEE